MLSSSTQSDLPVVDVMCGFLTLPFMLFRKVYQLEVGIGVQCHLVSVLRTQGICRVEQLSKSECGGREECN